VRIRDILDPRRILLSLSGDSKREILTQLAGSVTRTHRSLEQEHLVSVLLNREEISTTAIADGIAIPHAKMPLGDEVICAFGRNYTGLEFQSIDGKPTRLFFLLVSPQSHPSVHLRWLAHLAVLLKSAQLRRALLEAETAEAVLDAIGGEEVRSSAPMPLDEQ